MLSTAQSKCVNDCNHNESILNEYDFEFGALIDLHVHLDGSISMASAKELARMQGMPVPSDEQLHNLLCAGPTCHSLHQFLEKFDYPCSLLQTEAAITKSIENLLHEFREQGVIYTEIRFAPQYSMFKGLTMPQVVEAAIKGLDDSVVPCRLILSCIRGTDKKIHDLNMQTIEMVAKYMGRGVVCTDLAGPEDIFPTSDFADIFAYARQLGVPFVLHAGEANGAMTGVDSVRMAVDFGARRIEHGILATKDPQMVRELAERNVPLTICPSSNLCTELISDIKEFPYLTLKSAGVKVCINTDDMAIIGTDLRKEYELVRKTFGMTKADAVWCLDNAIDMSFAPEDLKAKLRKQVHEYYM
ncbi:MAG: adenosine deaminase [Prevotellaceae bacterium]|nr:adenosine deaminase [Prevotellaceae bacterium]